MILFSCLHQFDQAHFQRSGNGFERHTVILGLNKERGFRLDGFLAYGQRVGIQTESNGFAFVGQLEDTRTRVFLYLHAAFAASGSQSDLPILNGASLPVSRCKSNCTGTRTVL